MNSGEVRLRRLQQLQRRLTALTPKEAKPPPTLTFKVHGTSEQLCWTPQPVGNVYRLCRRSEATETLAAHAYTLLPHQADFITDRRTGELGLVGGFGSGKSRALVLRSILLAAEQPHSTGLVVAPTHRMGADVLQPVFHDVLTALGLQYKALKHPLPAFQLPQFGSQIIVRSGDAPDRLRGLSVHFAAIDELDTIAADHARTLWGIVSSRVREGRSPSLCTSTTPEGFGFAYANWVEQDACHKRLIRAKTTDNPFLPPSYLEALRSIYPAEALEAYINGQFVALDRGRVYPSFCRTLNASSETILWEDRLHVGLDFNIGKMAAVVAVRRRQDELHVVAEDIGAMDTDELIKRLHGRFPRHYDARQIVVHPDASSASRSTNSSQTDMAKLRQAGLIVSAPRKNPLIRDSVNTVNAAILDGSGRRRLFVHPSCTVLLKSLEQQCYDDHGQPDKSSDLDHPIDALRYCVWQTRNFAHAEVGQAVRGIRLY